MLTMLFNSHFVVATYVDLNALQMLIDSDLSILFCYAALFIDVGTNYSVLDHTNLSFIYEDVLSPGPNTEGEFVS